MKFKFGKSISIDSLSLEYLKKHPIWTWALHEEDNIDIDETWICPILDTNNVVVEMVDVIIFIYYPSKSLFGFANYYTQEKCITNLYVFDEDDFCWDIKDFDFNYPLKIKSEVKIYGMQESFFINKQQDEYGKIVK